MSGYTIQSPSGLVFDAHSDGSLTVTAGEDVAHYSPDDVETIREVLRLAAGSHARARRKACGAAYDERYGMEVAR